MLRNASEIAPLENLKVGHPELGFVTPRAMMFVASAAVIRSGGHLGFGVENTRWMSREMDRILRLSDVEIAFEQARRQHAPSASAVFAVFGWLILQKRERRRFAICWEFPHTHSE